MNDQISSGNTLVFCRCARGGVPRSQSRFFVPIVCPSFHCIHLFHCDVISCRWPILVPDFKKTPYILHQMSSKWLAIMILQQL